MVLGGTGSVLVGTLWCWVSVEWSVYYSSHLSNILKKVLIWSDVTIAGRMDKRTNERTRKDRATQPMDHGPWTAEMSNSCTAQFPHCNSEFVDRPLKMKAIMEPNSKVTSVTTTGSHCCTNGCHLNI